MVAGILTLFFVLSFIQNIMLLYSFYRNRRKLSPVDALIIYLICVNFFGVLVEFPIGIITNLSCKWILDEFGCDFSSSIMVYVGASSIYTMSLISYDRQACLQPDSRRVYCLSDFFQIEHTKKRYKRLKNLFVDNGLGLSFIGAVGLCIGFSFLSIFWAILPVFGVSEYVLEGALTSCSLDWTNKSLVSFIYVICLFVFVYVLPLAQIIYCNCKTISIVGLFVFTFMFITIIPPSLSFNFILFTQIH